MVDITVPVFGTRKEIQSRIVEAGLTGVHIVRSGHDSQQDGEPAVEVSLQNEEMLTRFFNAVASSDGTGELANSLVFRREIGNERRRT